MNTSKLDNLILKYLDEIYDRPCSLCLCHEYCKKVKAEMAEHGFWDENGTCLAIIKNWLNS